MELTSDFDDNGSLNWRVFRLFSSSIYIQSAVRGYVLCGFSVLFRHFKFDLKFPRRPAVAAQKGTDAK